MELRSLIEIFWRKRKTFGIFFLIVFLTILIVSWRIQPSFDATTKVQIVKSTAISSFFKAINVESTSSGSTFDDSELQDYNTIVTSGPVIDEFIEKLELKRERKWVQLIKMVPLTGPIIKAVGLQDNAMKPIAREELTNPGFLNLLFPSPSVKTELADESNVMEITAKSCDYPEAVLMANTLAEMLLEAEINIAKRDFEIMRKFANEKLISSAATYKKAMEETKKARDENATLNLSDDVTYLTDEINRIKQLINTTELNMNTTKIELEVNKKKLAARPMYMKASEQLKESSVYSGLRESISDLQVELAKIRTQYTAKHPDYIETEIQLKEAKDQLAKEVLKVYSSETIQIDPLVTELIQSVASDEATIAGQEEQLRSCNVQIKKLQSQVAYYTKTQMEMDLISSREAAAGDIYESMLDFLTQIEAAESMALANLKIIEPATISKKIGKHKHPSILINSILGFILACFFAFCGVVALEYIDPRIYNISGIPETDTMPIKTAVPDFLNKTKWFPKMPRKIPFRIMARKVAAELDNSQSKIIALVPFKTKTGCSTVAAGLSSELTSLGKKVLVLNLDKPSEKPWNSIERVQATASDLLSDKVKRKDSAVTTADINVDSTAQIKEVTSKLRDKYDLIIIDMPPPLHKESAFDTLDSCDAYMLVVKAGASSYASINNIMQFIQPHAQKLGLIINRTTPEFWSLFSREINL